ncbi:ABC transporter substrate-binding protein [Nocardia alni]|uniref:ABC transporter substrate-binding protein n=1 Tax=Nocardia alni TaxID=2815723 RepID=UPI001C248EDD|nr:ABC transporter substrate-binding protein [Nocardia alni]
MRRVALAVAVAAALLAACGCGTTSSAAPGAPATITVSLPGLKPAFAQSDIAVAQANGYFAEQKLTVHVQGLSAGTATLQSVIAGASDIGGSSAEPVLGTAGAAGLVIIGSYADRLPVVLETPSDITTPDGLKGKRLGIQSVGAFREIMTRAVYQTAHLTSADVHYVSVPDTGYVSYLLQHKIDSAVLQQEQSIDAESRDPSLHALIDMYKLMPDYVYGTYFVKSGWLTSHRDVAVRFLTAVTKAHRLIYSNRTRVVPEIVAATGYPPAVVDQAYTRLIDQDGIFPVNRGLDFARFAFTVEQMQQIGGLLPNGAPDMSKVIDSSLMDTAVARLGGPMKGDPRWH